MTYFQTGLLANFLMPRLLRSLRFLLTMPVRLLLARLVCAFAHIIPLLAVCEMIHAWLPPFTGEYNLNAWTHLIASLIKLSLSLYIVWLLTYAAIRYVNLIQAGRLDAILVSSLSTTAFWLLIIYVTCQRADLFGDEPIRSISTVLLVFAYIIGVVSPAIEQQRLNQVAQMESNREQSTLSR